MTDSHAFRNNSEPTLKTIDYVFPSLSTVNRASVHTHTHTPVLFPFDVGVAQCIVHAARQQLIVFVSHHVADLVCVALPREAVVLPSFCIPVMWGNRLGKRRLQTWIPNIARKQKYTDEDKVHGL